MLNENLYKKFFSSSVIHFLIRILFLLGTNFEMDSILVNKILINTLIRQHVLFN